MSDVAREVEDRRLALVERTHHLKALDRRVGRLHRFETAHRPNQLLELAVVGFDDVVQILDLPVLCGASRATAESLQQSHPDAALDEARRLSHPPTLVIALAGTGISGLRLAGGRDCRCSTPTNCCRSPQSTGSNTFA
jgi:hypothetical protein